MRRRDARSRQVARRLEVGRLLKEKPRVAVRSSARERTRSGVVRDGRAGLRREGLVVAGSCGAGQAVREEVAAYRLNSALLKESLWSGAPVVALRVGVSERGGIGERQGVLARRVEQIRVVVGRCDVNGRALLELVDGILLAVSATMPRKEGFVGKRLSAGGDGGKLQSCWTH